MSSNNFDTIILAGMGAVGSSMLRLGSETLKSFSRVILADRDPAALAPLHTLGCRCLCGDLLDPSFLRQLKRHASGETLLVNMCAELNNLIVREQAAQLGMAYLDSCASATEDPEEHRFSVMMEHTMTSLDPDLPHWLCFGINPGLVEIVARQLINELAPGKNGCDITVFEHDQIHAPTLEEGVAVGWCPPALIEEVMLSPSLVVEGGMVVEDREPPARDAVAFWEGEEVRSRIVAHEDIWNMALIPGVVSARFVYGLAPEVMDILAGDPGKAAERLLIPDGATPVFGLERVAVQARELATGERRTLLWETDHYQTWIFHGINGVQFQTASSLLLAVELLAKTRYGRIPGEFCGATFPMTEGDFSLIGRIMKRLNIHWQRADYLDLAFDEEFVDEERKR